MTTVRKRNVCITNLTPNVFWNYNNNHDRQRHLSVAVPPPPPHVHNNHHMGIFRLLNDTQRMILNDQQQLTAQVVRTYM